MAKLSEITATEMLWQEGSAPATPAATKWKVYFKTDGIYVMDDAGNEVGPLAAAAGGSGVTFAANLPRDIATLDFGSVNTSTLSIGAANRAHFIPFIPKVGLTTSSVFFRCSNATGNMDVGIYDASLTRLVSTGSTAIPGVGSQSLSLVQALSAGTLYYIAYTMSSTSSAFYGWTSGTNAFPRGLTASATMGAYAYLSSALPLPAGPVTPTGYDPYEQIIAFQLV